MLFKHKHLLEELRKTGKPAVGEILSMTTVGQGGSTRAAWAPDDDLTAGWMDCRMKLRVTPKDHSEAPFEASVLTRIQTMKYKGGGVPVWYDPSDHSRLVVDYEADVKAQMQSSADLDRMVHRNDQRVGVAWTPVHGALLPVEVMVSKGKGRLKVTGKLGELLRDTAAAAVSCVRNNAAALAPGLAANWFAKHDLQVDLAWGAVPSGATQEEAANAAIAVAAALVSVLTGRMVRPEVALTGKIGPSGELVAVDGFKDLAKIATAQYAQLLVGPAGNSATHRDPSRRGVEFRFAASVSEALAAALTRHPVTGYQPPA